MKRKRQSKPTHAGDLTNRSPDRVDLEERPVVTEDRQRPAPFTWWLFIIAAIALGLRLLHLYFTQNVPTIVQPTGDAAGYYQWAEKIAGGDWYGDETFYQAPLYPYFLAVLMKLLGFQVGGIRLAQAVLGALSVAFIGVAGKNWFSQRVGLISAAMLAVYPAAIFYDGIIQKTSLAAFLLCALLAAASSWQRWSHWALAVLSGVLLGLLVITRENALLWIPIFPCWIVFTKWQHPWRLRLEQACAFMVGAMLILLPVAARNASLGGEWSPTTFQAGPNFYIGNNQHADGIYRPLVAGHETPFYERADAQRIAEQESGRELSAREVSSFWMDAALGDITNDPSRWLALMLQKSFMVINHFEVPDVDSMHTFKLFSPLLYFESLWHFGVLCPLAVVGIATTRAHWQKLMLLYWLALVMIAAIALFFILGRYRFPLVPLLIPFAAVGLSEIRSWWTTAGWRDRCVTLTIGGIAALACQLPVHDQQGLDATSLMNQGVAACQAGNPSLGLTLLQEAARLAPELPEPHFNLGRAWAMTGRHGNAIQSFRNALRRDPQLVMVDSMLASSLERVGQRELAIVHYRRALAIDPQDQNARRGLERLQVP